MGSITTLDNRYLNNIHGFLSPQDCDEITELMYTYETKILELAKDPKYIPNHSGYHGTTKEHGKYNWLGIIEEELPHIQIIERLQTLLQDQPFLVDYETVWVKSWCNKLNPTKDIPYHAHSFPTEKQHFFSSNIFLSNNTHNWHTYYETYGYIHNEQGCISLLSCFLHHAVEHNHAPVPRYSMAMDIYTRDPKEDYGERVEEYKNLTKIYL